IKWRSFSRGRVGQLGDLAACDFDDGDIGAGPIIRERRLHVTKSDARSVAGPVEIFDLVVGSREFAWLAFAVRVLLNREHVEARELHVFINPAKVVPAF